MAERVSAARQERDSDIKRDGGEKIGGGARVTAFSSLLTFCVALREAVRERICGMRLRHAAPLQTVRIRDAVAATVKRIFRRHLHIASPARIAVDVEGRPPRGHTNRTVLISAMSVCVSKRTDLVTNRQPEVVGNRAVERTAKSWRRAEDGWASRHAVLCEAGCAEAVEALGVPIIP